MLAQRLRVAIIGSTGKENYGHEINTAFRGLDRAEIGAIADGRRLAIPLAERKQPLA